MKNQDEMYLPRSLAKGIYMKHAIESYNQAAELMQPGLGAWAYDRFAEFNQEYFDNTVPAMPILFVPMSPYGNWVGLAEYAGRILLWDKHALDSDYTPGLYAAHILLHEMLHQYLYVKDEDTKHNGHPWCREIMRIGKQMGLSFHASPSRTKRIKDENGDSKVIRTQATDGVVPSIPLKGGISSFPHFAFDYTTGTILDEYRASM